MGNIPSVATGQLATADQYNALQAGLNPLVENEYTSWKLITNVTTSAQTSGPECSLGLIDEVNNVLYIFDNLNENFWTCGVDGSNLTLINPSANYAFIGSAETLTHANGGRPASMTGLYVVFWTNPITGPSNSEIYILSKGKTIQTIDITAYFTINNLAAYISSTGRYILVAGQDATTNALRIQVYEGQP